MQSEVDLLHVLQMRHKSTSKFIAAGLHYPLWKVAMLEIAQSHLAGFMDVCINDLGNAQKHIKEDTETKFIKETETNACVKRKKSVWLEAEKKRCLQLVQTYGANYSLIAKGLKTKTKSQIYYFVRKAFKN